jgi:hypothetical protein
VVAGAQAQANQQTAELEASLNNMNYSGPQGQVNYEQYAPDRWLEQVNLSPAEQAIFNQSTSAQSGALGLANTQLGRVGDALSAGLEPGAGMAGSTPQVGDIWSTPAYASALKGFDPGQPVQGSIGPSDFGQAVQSARDAAYGQAVSRLDPQWAQAQESQQAQLVAQGLNPNDAAWQNATTAFNNARNDAYNQAAYSAVGAGNAEQARLFGQQAQQGQFANQAAAQQYAQNQGAAGFYNQALAQDYAAKLSEYNMNNAAENQAFNQKLAAGQFQDTAQQQAFQQGAYAQELPINELDALLSSGQVSMPSGAQYSATRVNPTNVIDAYTLNSSVAEQNYAQQLKNNANGLGGLFNLGAAALQAFA